MAALNNKIDFVVLVSANQANVNGDPLNGNRPRTDYSGYGEMSDVCIKRKYATECRISATTYSSSPPTDAKMAIKVLATAPPEI